MEHIKRYFSLISTAIILCLFSSLALSQTGRGALALATKPESYGFYATVKSVQSLGASYVQPGDKVFLNFTINPSSNWSVTSTNSYSTIYSLKPNSNQHKLDLWLFDWPGSLFNSYYHTSTSVPYKATIYSRKSGQEHRITANGGDLPGSLGAFKLGLIQLIVKGMNQKQEWNGSQWVYPLVMNKSQLDGSVTGTIRLLFHKGQGDVFVVETNTFELIL